MLRNDPYDTLKTFDWDEKNWVSDAPKNSSKEVSSIWEDMAVGASSIGSNVWDAAKGAWISTKELASETYTGLKTEVSSVGGGLLDYVQNKIIILALVIVLILYIAGKSGFFNAVIAVAK